MCETKESVTTPSAMQMLDIKFRITLMLRAPILSRSTSAAGFGVDAPVAKNHHGKLYLPATLIKGCLREALCELKEALVLDKDDINYWFGKESPEDSYDTSKRGLLEFSDFETDKQGQDELSYRIKIDKERGAADRGALMVMDMPFKSGQVVPFTGYIKTLIPKDHGSNLLDILEKGFRWIPSLGGQRGVGFGQINSVEIVEEQAVSAPIPDISALEKENGNNSLKFSLRPLEPFCISRHTPVFNLFDSEEIISGAVIKGTLAGTLNRILDRPLEKALDGTLPEPWKALGACFDRLRVTHAFPIYRSESSDQFDDRPRIPPLSIVLCNGKIYDVALKKGAGLIKKSAPTFSADWKDSDRTQVWRSFGWPTQVWEEKDIRVRTAMEYKQRRAKPAALFAIKRIIPDAFEWRGRIDINIDQDQVPIKRRADVIAQVKALMDYGLIGLGKTKVRAECLSEARPGLLFQPGPFMRPLELEGKPLWVVTLQTPALMTAPENIAGKAEEATEQLEKDYETYWKDISGDTLSLSHFFAKHVMKGRYLFYHFQKKAPYNPYLLTDSGSVFVLRAQPGKEQEAAALIGEWAWTGLPLPEWAKDSKHYGGTWDQCPWVPENGFGEIAVNLPCHTDLCPGKDEWEDA